MYICMYIYILLAPVSLGSKSPENLICTTF